MAFLGGPLLTGKRSLGASLGADLGSALQGLAQHKVQQKQANETAKFWTSQGVDAQTAHSLSQQPEAIQKAFFERWEAPQVQQQQPEMAQAPEQNMQPSYSPQEVNLLKSIADPTQRNKVAQMMQQQRQGAQPVDSTEPSRQFGQAAAQQQVAEKIAQPKVGGLKPANYKAQEKLVQDQALADYKQQRKENHELEVYERKRHDEKVDKSTDLYATELQKTHGLKEQLARLNRQEALNKSGKLSHQSLTAVRDTVAKGLGGIAGGTFGVDLTHLLSPESQEFEKLSKDMLSGLKDMYGARINQVEVESFLKTIPSLMQSTEGRQAVIENMRDLIEGKLLWTKAAKEVKQENGGKIPADLQFQVEERIAPQLDAIVDKFKNLQHGKVEKGNEGLVTSLLKAIPRAIL